MSPEQVHAALLDGQGFSAAIHGPLSLDAFRLVEGRGLRVLILEGARLTIDHFEIIASLPALRRLTLAQCTLGPADVEPLSGLPPLESLILRHGSVDDRVVESICEAGVRCEELTIDSLVSNACIASVKSTLATRLQLHSDGLDDEAVGLMSQLDLRVLDLRSAAITGSGLAAWTSPRLESLAVQDSPLDSKGLRGLRPLASLHTLLLENTSLDDSVIPHLASFANLRRLRLGGSPVSSAALVRHGSPRLDELSLTGPPSDEDALWTSLPMLLIIDWLQGRCMTRRLRPWRSG